ncbi:hypothetical protein [Corynebacterium wankanglinii]|uniref:hypothetical protein n=1 Tax=Corynebacterium wankanglinii TaxID=2735136 RepID=UPI0038B2748D
MPANDPARTNLLRNTLKPGAPIADDVALVVSTSGSTGTPKGAGIHLGGPMIARGYHLLDSPDLKDGWFRTSDAGTLENGVLTVLGRTDNVISSGGFKLHPEVLEEQLLLIDGVTAATVIGKDDDRLGQRICAAYTGSASVPDVLDALADAEDAGRISHWQIPKELKPVAALPQLGPGKVDRAAVKELF